jgi:hypothetical protein
VSQFTSPQIDHDLTIEQNLVNAALDIVKRSQALCQKQWGNRDPNNSSSIRYSRWLNLRCAEFMAAYGVKE